MTRKTTYPDQIIASSAEFIPDALQSVAMGAWEFDPTRQVVHWDKGCQELYGLPGLEYVSYEQTLSGVHPDDRPSVEQAREWALDSRSAGQYDIRFRTIGANTGRLRWIRCQGKAYFDQDGKAYRLAGVAQDVTQDQPMRRELMNPDRLSQLGAALLGVGVYRLGLVSDELVHTPGFAHVITGDANAILSRADFLRALHPQDELLRQMALEEVSRTGVYMYEPRFIWLDGTIHHTRIIGALHRDDFGRPSFIIGHLQELTQRPMVAETTELRYQMLVNVSPVAMGVFQGPDQVVETANEAMYQLLSAGREISSKPLLTALPHWQDQPFTALLKKAYTTGEPVTVSHQLVTSWQNNQLINRYYSYHYSPLLDAQRNVYAILATALDTSDQIGAQRRLEASEARFQSIIEQAPMAICILKGRSMLFEAGNAKALGILGTSEPLPGLPIWVMLPEMKEQGFMELLEGVFDTGQPYIRPEVKFELRRTDKLELFYLDLVYMPLRDTSRAVTGVMIMASDVTERVLARQAIEASEAKLSTVLNAAPTAMGLYVYVGRDLIIEMANQAFIDIVGKGPDIIGKPLRTVMPELESQPYLQIIDSVYTSGEPFEHFSAEVDIVRNGVMTHNYYNLNYSPLLDASGQIYAVLGTGMDVTREVKSRQALEERERYYRQLAEELAQ